jgi:polar amino acid transport system permease protein
MNYFVEHIAAVFPFLIKGAVYTVEITALSVFFGTLIGVFVGMGRLSKKKILSVPSSIYVDVIRGTPLLVQILIIYFGVPNLYNLITGSRFTMEPFLAAILACSINSGAYVAEIVRAGIQSIDRGQTEAARSLGMTHKQTMIHIILPQAFRRIIPPMGNEFIVLLKDTSLLSVIGFKELLMQGQIYISRTYASFPVLLSVAFVYLVMTWSISRFVDYTEYKLGVRKRA